MSCLKSLVHRGNEVLEKYFVAKFDEGESAVGGSKIGLELEPVSEAPGYASHLRVSFVKIPECGTILCCISILELIGRCQEGVCFAFTLTGTVVQAFVFHVVEGYAPKARTIYISR